MSKPSLFISYRQDRDSNFAARIHDKLVSKGFDVFLDIYNERQGNWEDNIFKEICERDYFLIILTEGSLSRCKDKNDFVRKEIKKALVCKPNNIIPITDKKECLNGYKDACPRDIKKLFDNQIIELRYESFNTGIYNLINLMRKEDNRQQNIGVKSFLDVLFPFLTLLAFSLTVIHGVDNNWKFSIFIPITLCCQCLWVTLSFSNEARLLIFIAFVMMIFGCSVLSGKLNTKRKMDDTLSIVSYITITFGLCMAIATMAVVKAQNRNKE